MAEKFTSPITVEDLSRGLRFFGRLPFILWRRVSLEEARAGLRRDLEHREENFLSHVCRTIYEYPDSPYQKLLGIAGCGYGDLEKLVRQDGVDGALYALFRQGVYLTLDEFKGRQPIIRGSSTLALNPRKLRNPLTTTHLARDTGGSRSSPMVVTINLSHVRDRALQELLCLTARGGTAWSHAIWAAPGSWIATFVLQYCAFGATPRGWFLTVDPRSPGLHARYRLSMLAMRWGSLLAGVRLPRPQYVSFKDPLPIVRWMDEVFKAGRIPHIYASPSFAVKLCETAKEAGVSLRDAQFSVGGEPVTAARLAVIHGAGANAIPRYGASETGLIGYGCLSPAAPDDLHLLHNLGAIIQPAKTGESAGLPPRALLVSSLLSSAPLILLNVSLGDQAEMARRQCGCPMEASGWTSHMHTIRSFEKLTAGGITLLDVDITKVLEEVLPARFGGGPNDYQLVEDEAPDGRPRLTLLVHPVVGSLDTLEVRRFFLSAIARGSGAERVMGLLCREAELLSVERQPPLATASGKIQHVHVDAVPPKKGAGTNAQA